LFAYSKKKKEVDKENIKLSIHFKGERTRRQRRKKETQFINSKKGKTIGSQIRRKRNVQHCFKGEKLGGAK
jgi:hypothetical protein